MCVLIHKSAGTVLESKDDLELAFLVNPHGAGFAWKEDGKVYVKKGFFTFESLWSEWQNIGDKEAMLHFRSASQGTVNRENCHPFIVDGVGVVGHNGHFNGFGTKTVSDTRDWIDSVLKPFLQDFPQALDRLSSLYVLDVICERSRLIVMRNSEPTVIINEDLGVREDGLWYSNIGYRNTVKSKSRYRVAAHYIPPKVSEKAKYVIPERDLVSYYLGTPAPEVSEVYDYTQNFPVASPPDTKTSQICDGCMCEADVHLCTDCYEFILEGNDIEDVDFDV